MTEQNHDGAVRLKSQSELLEEEEQAAAIERSNVVQRRYITSWAKLNDLHVESFMDGGDRYCILVGLDDDSKRTVLVQPMIENAFRHEMLQYIASLQSRYEAAEEGAWEEAKEA